MSKKILLIPPTHIPMLVKSLCLENICSSISLVCSSTSKHSMRVSYALDTVIGAGDIRQTKWPALMELIS